MNFSIIIPAFNVEKTITDCLNSLLELDYNKGCYEIIVINDGSTDKTELVLKSFSKKYKQVRSYTKKNGGKGSAINFGLEKVKFQYVAITDSDCVADKNWLKNISEGFTSEKVGYVNGVVYNKRPRNIISKIQQAWYFANNKYAFKNS